MSDLKWCRGCGQLVPIERFTKRPKRVFEKTDARCRDCSADALQVRKHGLTRADKQRIAQEQGGCLTCRRLDPGGKGWVVDHDRSCCPGDKSCRLCRRGILCQWCNSALGYAQDSPTILRHLADYLESGERVQ